MLDSKKIDDILVMMRAELIRNPGKYDDAEGILLQSKGYLKSLPSRTLDEMYRICLASERYMCDYIMQLTHRAEQEETYRTYQHLFDVAPVLKKFDIVQFATNVGIIVGLMWLVSVTLLSPLLELLDIVGILLTK